MEVFDALILGLLQGLTEFLPVSSSGHLELAKVLLGADLSESLAFTVMVHGATVLSTIVVFRKDLYYLFRELFRFEWNESTAYLLKIIVSMVPVGLVGVFFKDQVEMLFNGNLRLVGTMLLVTALFLITSQVWPKGAKDISFGRALWMGIAQAIAVIPGISRSGATISTGLMFGVKKESVTRFSFLMVLIPVIGANLLDIFQMDANTGAVIGILPLSLGFLMAFISGLLACKWMIKLVNQSRLIYFVVYCLLIGIFAILYS